MPYSITVRDCSLATLNGVENLDAGISLEEALKALIHTLHGIYNYKETATVVLLLNGDTAILSVDVFLYPARR